MNDLESELRGSLHEHLDNLQISSMPPTIPRKARRSRMVTLVGSLSMVVAVVAAAFIGVRAIGDPRKGADRALETAGSTGATYLLDNFKIDYPYVGPSVSDEPDPTRAGVTYVVHWATGEYPGNVGCEMRLMDRNGQLVGGLHFSVDSATDGFTRANLPVPVSLEPISAEATCDPGDYAEGAGYIYEGPSEIAPARNPTGKPYGDRLEFTFDVRWEYPDVAPEMRTCYLTVIHEGGAEQDPVRFDANIGQGKQMINAYVGDPSTVQTARVSCGEL